MLLSPQLLIVSPKCLELENKHTAVYTARAAVAYITQEKKV